MNTLDEIKEQILNAIRNNINDESKTVDEKWIFIELASRLLGHYECEEANETPLPNGAIHFYSGDEQEFSRLKLEILGIE